MGIILATNVARIVYGMESDLTKSRHYLDRALQMRDLAAQEIDLEAKKALISVGEMYDRLSKEVLGRAGKAGK